MPGRQVALLIPSVIAIYMPFCAPSIRQTAPASPAQMAQLWEHPANVSSADTFDGPWGKDRAPDPTGSYTFVERKRHGTNPGVTVRDAEGHEWHVKQAPETDQGAEGPVEVTLSRVLSAIGYHQPPVYFLPSFRMTDELGWHPEPGGRFRLHDGSLKEIGPWSWQENPFVGTKPYQGLIAILMLFNSSDLKNSNNALYEVKHPIEKDDPREVNAAKRWYVVKDIGSALGETGRMAPKRGSPDLFEQIPFINGVKNGFVEFNYHGFHQELVRERLTPDDLRWASALLSELTDAQWRDAFRAGGFEPAVAERFIRRLKAKIAEGERLSSTALARPGAGPAVHARAGGAR